ncbi:MAG TPA: SAM-dependent methyltransferase [Candidatus Binatia bacterium]|nr:SAM-dependent methyltransferase [Candidatus Binatia bacterium]
MLREGKSNQKLQTTAFWTAAVRAKESERDDRLFDDPWAADLAGPEGLAWIQQRTPDSYVGIALRTRFFDDFLQRIAHEHGIRQIVLLAAGLDTRAFRLNWPEGTKLFELDQPAVLAYKEQVLGAVGAHPGCARRGIGIDLTADWESTLLQSDFDPALLTGWLLEGFLFYLPTASLTQLLERTMALAADRSFIAFDVVNSLTLTSPLTKDWVQMQAQLGAPWIGSLEDPQAFLQERGWQVTLSGPGAEDANHGRWSLPVIPLQMPGIPHLWFVVGHKDATSRS